MASVSITATRSIVNNEVSLFGNVIVSQGTTATYQITDYNSFSSYAVSSSEGTATITGDSISLTVPNPTVNPQINLTVNKDASTSIFVIAVGSSAVVKPTITSPTQGQIDVNLSPNLTSSAFATVPVGLTTHASSQWQISTNSSFSSTVFDSGVDTVNKTIINIPFGVLSPTTTYYARMRQTGASLGTSVWSDVRTFVTNNKYVATPTASIIGGTTQVYDTPTLQTTAFSVVNGTDTHSSTDWIIRKASDNSLVWSSIGNTTNKTSIIVPMGFLQVNTNYILSVRHIGSSLGPGGYATLPFTTRAVFFVFAPSSAGMSFGGGYYAGANILVGDKKYALVVASKVQGGETQFQTQWKTELTYTSGADSVNDGVANTNACIAQGATLHPAANFCRNLNINGFTDWYLPSSNELEICYRYLKPGTTPNSTTGGSPGVNNTSEPLGAAYTASNPPQTPVAIFKTGGAEAFVNEYGYPGVYWSSSAFPVTGQGNDTINARNRSFYDGDSNSTTNAKNLPFWVRAVRRVEITS